MKMPSNRTSRAWRDFFRKAFRKFREQGRSWARRARIDPSYVTHIVRNGYQPGRKVAKRIASALEQDETKVLFLCGHCPPVTEAEADHLVFALEQFRKGRKS